jgi:hypothetical protein
MGGNELIQLEEIQTRIYTIRGVQVMLEINKAVVLQRVVRDDWIGINHLEHIIL